MSLILRIRRDGTVTPEGTLPAAHHFDPRWLTRAVTAGYATLGKGQITLHLADGDAAYRIVRGPGAYCAECGHQVGDGPATTPQQVTTQEGLLCDGATREVINHFDTEKET